MPPHNFSQPPPDAISHDRFCRLVFEVTKPARKGLHVSCQPRRQESSGSAERAPSLERRRNSEERVRLRALGNARIWRDPRSPSYRRDRASAFRASSQKSSRDSIAGRLLKEINDNPGFRLRGAEHVVVVVVLVRYDFVVVRGRIYDGRICLGLRRAAGDGFTMVVLFSVFSWRSGRS